MPVAIVYPEALEAFFRHAGPPAEAVHVSAEAHDYWRLFVRLWNDGHPFIIVEHDIVIGPRTTRDLAECEHLWCAFPYHEAPGDPVTGLGCTKVYPDLGAIYVDDPAYGNPVWQNVDSVVGGILTAVHGTVHVHEPWLRHLNPRVTAEQRDRNEATP